MKATQHSRLVLLVMGIVCSLLGGVSGDLYSARTRQARGTHARVARQPNRGQDQVHEPESQRGERLYHEAGHSAPNPDHGFVAGVALPGAGNQVTYPDAGPVLLHVPAALLTTPVPVLPGRSPPHRS